MNVLAEYAEAVKELYKQRLIADDKVASGKLINSVETFIAYQGTELLVTFKAEDYFRWVEQGRKPGTLPPPSKILDWILVKPVLPHPNENGKLPTPEQLSWAIAKKIERDGIDAGNQLAETVEALNRQYIPLLQEALEKDFEVYSIYILESINKMLTTPTTK